MHLPLNKILLQLPGYIPHSEGAACVSINWIYFNIVPPHAD